MTLTPTQRRVVIELALHGSTNAQIGRALNMAPSTVRTHLDTVRRRLRLHTRAAVVAWAWRTGVVQRLYDTPVTTTAAPTDVVIWSVA